VVKQTRTQSLTSRVAARTGDPPPQFRTAILPSRPPRGRRPAVIKDEAVLQIPGGYSAPQLQILMSRRAEHLVAEPRPVGRYSYRVRLGHPRNSVASVIGRRPRNPMVAGDKTKYTYRLAQERDAGARTLVGAPQGRVTRPQYALASSGVMNPPPNKGTNARCGRRLENGRRASRLAPPPHGVVADPFDASDRRGAWRMSPARPGGRHAGNRPVMGHSASGPPLCDPCLSAVARTAERTKVNISRAGTGAASTHVNVINMSFAGPRDPSLERSLKLAHDKGIVLIAAGRNAQARQCAAALSREDPK